MQDNVTYRQQFISGTRHLMEIQLLEVTEMERLNCLLYVHELASLP